MVPLQRITLEDLLACWRAAVALGARSDPAIAADLSRAIVRETAFTRRAPEAPLAGDRSIASAAQRIRARARPDAPTASLSNSQDLRALGFVATALAAAMTRPRNPGTPQQGPQT